MLKRMRHHFQFFFFFRFLRETNFQVDLEVFAGSSGAIFTFTLLAKKIDINDEINQMKCINFVSVYAIKAFSLR